MKHIYYYMKSFSRITSLCVFLGFLLSTHWVQASHFMGVDISYECMAPCTYRIYHTSYYDCSGTATPVPVVNNAASAPLPPNNNFDIIGTGAGCNDPVMIGAWNFVSYMEVTPVCPTATTECDGTPGLINGVAEAVYYADFDFCNVNCTEYTLTWETCCRNYGITSGASGDGIYSGVTTINTSIMPCNSSPKFSNPPVPYLCEGQAFTFNQGAFDPDGDSLVYSLGPCWDDAGTQVGYDPGFTPVQPLGAGWDVQINSFTGDITITPNPAGPQVTAVMCVYVEEYRNGVLIGQVSRDMQITVIDCSIIGNTNVSPTIAAVTTSSPGASATGFTVEACACQEVCIEIPSMDPDTGQTYQMYWNQNLDGVFSDFSNPGVPLDTITSATPPTGQFCWTPTQTGLFTFLVTIVDDGCPIIGINQYTVIIDVGTCPTSDVANTTLVGCYDMLYSICGGPAPGTGYTWTGPGGLNGTGDSLLHTYPGPGTYNWTLSIYDSATTTTLTTSGSITLTNTATADGGPDVALCPSDVATIGTPGLPGYTYQWSSPGNTGFVSPTNQAEVDVALNNQTPNPIPVEFLLEATDPNGCVAYDTVTVTFTPKPPAVFSVGLEVCEGDFTTAVYSSSPIPGTIFYWDYDGGTGTTTGPGPHQVSWANAGTKNVTLWVDVNGCISDTQTVQVTVHDIPSANFITVNPVCANQSSLITYTGSAGPTATYLWDFDGGTGGSGQGPFGVTWATDGAKEIELTVIENNCVSPVYSEVVTVHPVPTSDFSLATEICMNDLTQITYTGTASGAGGYAWNFDGGQVVSGSGMGPYTVEWLTPGPKTVCLQVEENGCISTLSCQTINILDQPNADIAPISNQCFDGNSITFTYTGDPNVTTYIWNFGADATPPTSTDAAPTAVTYINPGIKTVSLVVTRDGCVSDSALMTFEVVPDPEANFSFSTGAVCQNECITFNYTGTPVGTGQTYQWNFDTGAIPASSTQPNPGCIEFADGGTKSISLLVNYKGCTDAMVQSVTIHPGPIASAGADVEFCDGEGGVQVDASVVGGTMPYYYSWWCDDPPNCGLSDPFTQDPVANPDILVATDVVTYYFQTTDFNGCASNIDSVRVTVKAKPRLDAGPDVNICAEGPGAFLNGGPASDNNAPLPFTYQWTPSEGINDANIPNPYARPDTTTIYTLQATSSNGCTSEVNTLDTVSTVTVHVNDLPIADAGADTAVCLYETVQLQGFASGAGPDYGYQWTPALPGTIDDPTSASPTVSPSFTTYFYLVVSSNGCNSYADSVLVIVDTKPTLSPGLDETICLFDSVQLDGTAAGDPNADNYTYEWTPGTGLSDPFVGKPFASPNQTTVYSVVATSQFGCGSDAAQITVTVEPTPIVLAITPDTIICEGDEILLEAIHDFKTPPGSPVVYEWTPQDGSILTSPFVPDVTVAPTTTTLYTVTTSVSGDCPTTDEVLVTVSPAINPTLTADTNRVCEGVSTQLHATGGIGNATFQWSPIDGLDDPTSSNPFATPSQTTDYKVVISEGACVDSLSVLIDVNPAPKVDYFFSQGDGCEGLEVSFLENSDNGTNFIWDFGDGSPLNNEANPTHIYAEAGVYDVTLTVIGSGGCEASLTKATISISDGAAANFTAVPEAPAELALPYATVEFTDASENAVNWMWDFGDGNVSSLVNPVHTYEQAGEYAVRLTITDMNGCVSVYQYGPFIVLEPNLMIPNMFTPNGDGVNDLFTIRYTGTESYQLEVYDRWGRRFFSSNVPAEAWEGTDNQGGQALEGVYYYNLMIGEKSYRGDITLMR